MAARGRKLPIVPPDIQRFDRPLLVKADVQIGWFGFLNGGRLLLTRRDIRPAAGRSNLAYSAWSIAGTLG
jgi:hypothetical protein